MDDQHLALLHKFEQADEAIAVELIEFDELLEAVESLRTGALELESFFATLPTERAAAAVAVDDAEHALAEAETAVQKAAAELASAVAGKNEERLADARRFDLRARDSLHMAERAATASRERVALLDHQAAAAERETAVFENRAAELSAVLVGRPRLTGEAVADPGSGPGGVAEWGTRARAALLVARSQLVTERDAVVRQANELGTALLGEALPPLGTAAVARRVEQALL